MVTAQNIEGNIEPLNEEKKLNRRAFLSSIVASSLGTVMYEANLKMVSSLGKTVLQESAGNHPNLDVINDIFGNMDDSVGYAGGYLEAFKGVHPDNVAASAQLAKVWPIETLQQNGMISLVDEGAISFTSDLNLILLGGPISNDLLKAQFEYQGDIENLERAPSILNLPYYTYCNRSELNKWQTKRYLDKKLHISPRYHIKGTTKEYIPELAGSNYLKDDYLLISRLPNIIGFKTLKDIKMSGKTILSFQGIHGTGTRALDVLWQNRDILMEISNKACCDHLQYCSIFY